MARDEDVSVLARTYVLAAGDRPLRLGLSERVTEVQEGCLTPTKALLSGGGGIQVPPLSFVPMLPAPQPPNFLAFGPGPSSFAAGTAPAFSAGRQDWRSRRA